ncbi:Uncharacterised protein [uncultured archaeon]|nr:Uncharacterised protein [uncultured archaeon]
MLYEKTNSLSAKLEAAILVGDSKMVEHIVTEVEKSEGKAAALKLVNEAPAAEGQKRRHGPLEAAISGNRLKNAKQLMYFGADITDNVVNAALAIKNLDDKREALNLLRENGLTDARIRSSASALLSSGAVNDKGILRSAVQELQRKS